MDAAYYPSPKMRRQRGVLELLAASASREHFDILGRSTFTRTLAEQLRTRAERKRSSATAALSATELHANLLSVYPGLMRHPPPDRDAATAAAGLPSPLHVQMSGSPRLPSITLAPLPPPRPRSPRRLSPDPSAGPQLTLSMRLTEEALDLESWTDWLRMMPDGIRDVKVDVPFHHRLFR